MTRLTTMLGCICALLVASSVTSTPATPSATADAPRMRSQPSPMLSRRADEARMTRRLDAQTDALLRLARSAPRPSLVQRPHSPTTILAQADAAYDDAVGDAPGGLAPDVRRVAIVNDTGGNLALGVTYANRACATAGDFVVAYLDVDQNSATGTSEGVEYAIYIDGTTSTFGAARWDGSAFQPVTLTSLQATCDPSGFNAWAFNRSFVGIANGFDFFVAASYTDSAGTSYTDYAPDASVWNYQLTPGTSPPPPPPPPSPPPPPRPPPSPPPPPSRTLEDAPRLPKRERYTGASIRHAKAARAIYSTMKLLGLQKQLNVACWSKADWRSVVEGLGLQVSTPSTVLRGFWTGRQPRFLHISPKTCEDLQLLISTRRGNANRASASVTALHETAHMYGVRNEAQANCYSVQLVYYFARRLRVLPAQAAGLERLAVRATRARAPRGYWNSQLCRDGGLWDLDDEGANLSY